MRLGADDEILTAVVARSNRRNLAGPAANPRQVSTRCRRKCAKFSGAVARTDPGRRIAGAATTGLASAD